jgi:ribose transport system substrate-binding protein
VENAISRGVDAIVLAPNSSNALNNAIDRARKAGKKVIIADTAVTTDHEGFIGTDNKKAGEQAGERLCQLLKQQGKDSGDVMIESSVAGIQVLKDRDAGFREGLKACPGVRIALQRYNNNDINTAASQVNDALTANPNLIGIFADNNTSGDGAARAIKDNKAAARIPVVAFDTDPAENAALRDGSIDALVVQNPYFFGYQGVVEAGMATVGTAPPRDLDPGAVVADKSNMDKPEVKALLNPPTAKAG